MQDKDIKPMYKHSKFGNFMFFICAKMTKLLTKARFLYYFLACTWGIVLTFVGLLITLALAVAKIFDRKIRFERYCWVYGVRAVSDWWGGLEMGLMFIRDYCSWEELSAHEFGHTFQNCLFGPLMLFIVSLPSAIRYWHRELKYNRKQLTPPTAYDAIWFEDAATQCGKYATKVIREKAASK